MLAEPIVSLVGDDLESSTYIAAYQDETHALPRKSPLAEPRVSWLHHRFEAEPYSVIPQLMCTAKHAQQANSRMAMSNEVGANVT